MKLKKPFGSPRILKKYYNKELDKLKLYFDNNLDFYKHALKTRMLDKHGFGSKKATRKLIERVKNYNPDVIQLHGLTGYYINIEILFNFLKEYNKLKSKIEKFVQ